MLPFMSSFLLGLVPALLCAWAEDPQWTPLPLHNYAKFGAYAISIPPEVFRMSADQKAACNMNDDEAEIPATEHTPQLLNIETTLANTARKETSESMDPLPTPDYTWLMQTVDDDKAWRSFLQHVRSRLETVNKIELAMITDGLLRRLDWHATNRAAGYLLGHMGGRTEELTSLFVAFRDDMEIDSEIYEPPEVEGIWREIQHFVPMHPGSDRRHGRRLSQDPPCIMMTMREISSEFLTPGNTPSQRTPPAATPKQSRRKFLKVEINAENQNGEGSHTVMLPLNNNEANLHLRLTVKNHISSDEEGTVAAGSSPGTPLAPGLLGEAGLSLNDLMDLHEKWSRGALSMSDVELCHGARVARELSRRWQGLQQGGNDERDNAAASGTSQRGEPDEGGPEKGNEDETTLLSLHAHLILAAILQKSARGMDYDEQMMGLLREHLYRQRGEGTTQREQTSTLYHLMENRGKRDYMEEFPAIAEQLGLEVDVDLSHRCLPGATPFFVWLEAEIWSQYADQVEGIMGFETEVVQSNRATPTMSEQDMEEWRHWAGMRGTPTTRDRSRTPRRGTTRTSSTSRLTRSAVPGEDPTTGDATSLMHWGTWSDSRTSNGGRRRHRRRRSPRSGERDRSRNGRPAMGSTRALRIQERVTRETRHLGRECATSSWEPRRPVPEDTAGQAPTHTAVTGEMDILEATGRWFVMLGLRRPGQESHEPSNAMTKSMQAEARSTLRSMSEADLSVMVTALLRLTGMLYIESARLLTQARDDRRRTSEEVEVEIEADEDDESIYMQKFAVVQPKAQWGDLLQELLRLAETGGEANKGLLTGLQRRIRDSLYLQTEKGAQLQATLVVAVHSAEEGATEVCDTEDNDARLLEEWWGKLKRLMDFGADGSQARGSGDQVGTMAEGKPLAEAEHLDQEVQRWEAERQDLEAELDEEHLARQAQLRQREEEEREQERRDEVLYEQHRAGLLRDWEQWVVLHSAEPPKRRRLMVTAEHADARAATSPVQTTMVLPQGADRIDTMKVTFQVAVEPDLPEVDQHREPGPTPLDPTGELYDKVYRTWKNGLLQDEGVIQIFGQEWLFLFQINRDGLEGDTMAGQHGATQLDSEGRTVLEQTGMTSEHHHADGDRANGLGSEGWGHVLRGESEVLQIQLDDSGEDHFDEGEGYTED